MRFKVNHFQGDIFEVFKENNLFSLFMYLSHLNPFSQVSDTIEVSLIV